MIKITRININRCKISSDNEEDIDLCRKLMSFQIEGAEYSDLFKEGKWDGKHKFIDRNCFIGLGLVPLLIEKLKKKKKEFRYTDYFIKDNKINICDIDERMFYYQNQSIQEFFKKNCGIIKVPPRGGKTYIASEMSRIFLDNFEKGSFLFIVDTEDLYEQALDDISSYLGLNISEIGQINSKNKIFKRVNVAMVQTLVSTFSKRTKDLKKKRSLLNFLKTVIFLSVDEVHENSSDKRIEVFKKCKNLQFLAAFSGTPKKQFGYIDNLKLQEYFGDIVYEIKKSQLQQDGYLSMDKVFLIHVNHKNNSDFSDSEGYREYLTNFIHKNDYRNSLICQAIDICIKNKWKTLVLFNSKVHGKIISEEMGITFISGDDDTKTRKNEKNEFLSGRGKVLLASNIFKKGITLPEAQVLIIGDGGQEGTNITQKYSRVLGVTKDKTKAAIIDFMDSGVDYFNEHSLNRLSIYSEEMGDKNIEVYDGHQLSFLEEGMSEWLNSD